MSKIKSFINDIAPNAYWDAIKFIAYLLGAAIMSTGISSWFLHSLTTISLNSIIIFGLFIISLLFITAAYLIGNQQKQPSPENAQVQNQVQNADRSEGDINESSVVRISTIRSNTKLAGAMLTVIVLSVLVAVFFLGRLSLPANDKFNNRKFTAAEDLPKVTNKTFTNERVVLDGKHFEDCIFTNVTLIYNGTDRFGLRHNRFRSSITVGTESEAVEGAIGLFKGLGMVTSDIIDNTDRTPITIQPMQTIQPPQGK